MIDNSVIGDEFRSGAGIDEQIVDVSGDDAMTSAANEVTRHADLDPFEIAGPAAGALRRSNLECE